MKSQQFFIPYIFPSMNKVIDNSKQHWSRYAKTKTTYENKVCWVIREAQIKPMEAVSFEFEWHEKNKRRDPDNIGGFGRKVIIDALVKMGVIKNDGWGEVKSINETFRICKPLYPGVMVTLKK